MIRDDETNFLNTENHENTSCIYRSGNKMD